MEEMSLTAELTTADGTEDAALRTELTAEGSTEVGRPRMDETALTTGLTSPTLVGELLA